MRAGAFLLAILWFLASTYAGYRLTERSFAWIDEPGLGLSAAPAAGEAVPAAPSQAPVDIEALKGMTKEQLMEEAKKLTPQQLLCLRASISPDRVSAVLAGDVTPQEAAAAQKCLE